MSKRTKKKGSCHFLADKCYFENPLVTRWGVVIAMLKHIISWLQLIFFFPGIFPWLWKCHMKSRERVFPLMEKVGDVVFFKNFSHMWEKDLTSFPQQSCPLCGPRRAITAFSVWFQGAFIGALWGKIEWTKIQRVHLETSKGCRDTRMQTFMDLCVLGNALARCHTKVAWEGAAGDGVWE